MILKTFKKSSQESSCNGTSRVTSTTLDGGVLRVLWGCSEGHIGFWTLLKVLCEKNGQNIYVNSLLLSAGVFISSNNFDKLLLCKFLGLFISKATYNRMQTHFVIPEVKAFWEEMK